MATWYRWRGDTLILAISVQPRASQDEIVGVYGDRLKVRITAPPVEGKANQHLVRFLSKVFKVSRGQVSILSGESGRHKRIQVEAPVESPEAILNGR